MPHHTTVEEAAEIYYEEYLRLFKINRTLNEDLIEAFEARNQLAEVYNHLRVSSTSCSEKKHNLMMESAANAGSLMKSEETSHVLLKIVIRAMDRRDP